MTQTINDYLEPLVASWMLPVLQTALGIAVILFFGSIATYVLVLLFRRMERLAGSAATLRGDPRGEYLKSASTILRMVRTVVLAGLWVLLVIMMLSQAGLDITPVLAGAGIFGLAVGFGAQNLVRDLISGVFLILENQIRVGDIAQINGIGGRVEKITFRIVVLRDLKQVVHVIPHGKIDTLANLTKEWSAMVLDVGVAYKEHPDEVIAALQEVGEKMAEDPDWKAKILQPLEVLGVEEFADSGVIYRMRFMTLPVEQWGVMRELRRRIKISFDRKGIEFPFPHRTIFFDEASPPLPIRVLPDEGLEPSRSQAAAKAPRSGAATKAAGKPPRSRAATKAATKPRRPRARKTGRTSTPR